MARSPVRRAATAIKHARSTVSTGAAIAKTMRAGTALTLAAGQTIARRGVLLQGTGAVAQRQARGEMLRMVPEKIMAGAAAGMAMWSHTARLNGMVLNYWSGHMMRMLSLTSNLMSSRTPQGAAASMMRSAESGLSHNVSAQLTGVRAAQTLAQAGAKPLHRVAAANAKRLTRSAKR